MADVQAPSDRNFEEQGAQFTSITGGRVNEGVTDPAKPGFDPRNKHPEYMRLEEAWRTTRDVYEGAEAMVPRAKEYVPQRKMGEADSAYEERVNLLHFDGILGALVDMMVGLWARKPPEEESWGLLGPEGENGEVPDDSVAGKLIRDADRCGTSWENLRRMRATDLVVYRWYVSYVDTNNTEANVPRTEEGEVTREAAQRAGVRPYVNKATALDLLDWIEKDGRLIEAVVKEGAEQRDSLEDGRGTAVTTYLRFMLTGWERYIVEKDDDGNDKVSRIGTGPYSYVDDQGLPRLPVVRRKLPSPRYAAYTLSRVVLQIINQDSHLDAMLRGAALGQFLAIQGDQEEIRKTVKVGDKILPYPSGMTTPAFVGLGTDAAVTIQDRVESLTERFWRMAMFEFTDRARERTATEVEQSFASGIGAFLTLLSGVCEEIENEEKSLLAQAVQPPTEAVAFRGDVGATKFAREFKVEDVIAELERLKELVFGPSAPLSLSDGLSVAVGSHILTRLDEQFGVLGEDNELDVEDELRAKAEEDRLERERMEGRLEEASGERGFPEEDAA